MCAILRGVAKIVIKVRKNTSKCFIATWRKIRKLNLGARRGYIGGKEEKQMRASRSGFQAIRCDGLSQLE